MPARLGLPAIVIAVLLALGAPVLADDATSTTDPPASTIAPEPAAPVIDESATTPAAITSPALEGDGVVNSPATHTAQRATRGTQVQITPPPPRPVGPFDPPADGGFGRRIVYSKSKQTVWVYDETNTIIKMHRVSGRQTPLDPSPGTYQVWSRSLSTQAIHNPTITWGYMVRFAKGGRGGNIGFHEIPYQYGRPVQSIDQLGEALSGGCVRQATPDAIWMWDWAQIGTVVIVTP